MNDHEPEEPNTEPVPAEPVPADSEQAPEESADSPDATAEMSTVDRPNADAPEPPKRPAAGDGTRWGRMFRAVMTPRFTGAGAVIAVLVGLLGFALIAQVKTNDSSSTLSSDRPDDLVRILSDLDSRKDRLNTEITSLQETQRQLSSGAQGKQAALSAAAQRANELGILAGTLPAQGPGLVVQIRPTKGSISATVVLDAVEELRGAGAEAMQISGSNGPTVRIVASTWFIDDTGGVVVSGSKLTGTLTLSVIGDAQTMQTALNIPGGVDDTVQNNGGTVVVQQQPIVRVNALASAVSLKYAHPAS